ncbi:MULTISPECIES: BlaI/MecI/CopY family transcriptional regulator [Rosistilla]|nr:MULTISPECIES: BlaI/MecI/CopY family transcriptional regulator [Rosistilla]
MRNKSVSGLTAAEAEVMNVIWGNEPTGIPDIVAQMPRELAYSTVMTTVRILCDKGFVRQCGKEGRAFIYESCVGRDEVRCSMVRDLAERLFGGSVKSMVMNMIQEETIDAQDLKDVKKMIRDLEARQ